MSIKKQEAMPRVIVGVDSAELYELFESELKSLGCSCIPANDLVTFAQYLDTQPVDAAIVDLRLAGDSAVKLFQREPELLEGISVLAYASDGNCLTEIVAAVRAGVLDVISDPIDLGRIEVLAAEAKKHLSAAQARNPSQNRPNRMSSSLPKLGDVGLENGNRKRESSMSSRFPLGSNQNDSLARDGYNPYKQRAAASASDSKDFPRYVGKNGSCGDPNFRLEEFLIGNSAVMESVRRKIVEVASTKATVMICGESGTGKEVVATAIHCLSKRWQAPFVPVNMGAIPEGLAESLLFGHIKGAFTGAVKQQLGHCEIAHGGTLFLDEISEMEIQIQPRLLRFLQSGVFQRIGAETQQHADVRIITATNRDPKAMVREGRLREDLFFRLNVVPINIPPLRERSEDIDELASVFLDRYAEFHERPVKGFTEEALGILREFYWPGNVRQLEHIVERMVIFAHGPYIGAEEVPAEVQSNSSENPFSRYQRSPSQEPEKSADYLGTESIDPAHLKPIQRRERAAIIEALQQVDGHVVEASKLLGLGQATVYRKIKQYAIPHQRRRKPVTSRQ